MLDSLDLDVLLLNYLLHCEGSIDFHELCCFLRHHEIFEVVTHKEVCKIWSDGTKDLEPSYDEHGEECAISVGLDLLKVRFVVELGL